jgi:hypothetical protein
VPNILADANISGHVDALVARMRAEPWSEFWQGLGLVYLRFDDVGLQASASDAEIWHRCQSGDMLLITDNRNRIGPESLEDTIRLWNRPDSLPVFTIADVNKFRASRSYAKQVVERLYDYLLRIDEVCGTGRLYLP